jgi:hypothetical protein
MGFFFVSLLLILSAFFQYVKLSIFPLNHQFWSSKLYISATINHLTGFYYQTDTRVSFDEDLFYFSYLPSITRLKHGKLSHSNPYSLLGTKANLNTKYSGKLTLDFISSRITLSYPAGGLNVIKLVKTSDY